MGIVNISTKDTQTALFLLLLACITIILSNCNDQKVPQEAITREPDTNPPLPTPSPSTTTSMPPNRPPTPTIDPQRPPGPGVTSSAVTPDGSLWYAFDTFDGLGGSPPGSQNHGLYRRLSGEILHYDIPATIRVLEVAPDGNLYIGAGCGVLRYRDDVLESLLDIDCNPDQPVSGLFPLDITFTNDGRAWVGGAYNLASYDSNGWTEYNIPARRVAIASDGTIWTYGWDGRAEHNCCLTHISGNQLITYTLTADVPAEPKVLISLFD
jgi:hypothetical protein